ncbi:hypothetical protein CEE61_02495 [Stenotrophomonas maltophilia]|uniref:hypothetical protein n=1 Tax=Stenotrophomonas TaxID=40323 RepID=UPI000B4C394B|nr:MULTISPECIES: hypothetical protein [unclassified Stenotrophomonas]OWQ62684.1 hypothetical protein CEE61_02495 [Stenotrophomonas maltophilia]MRE90769.1 hypothetical protein [Stenotrophomonas sp. M37]MRF23029.1 hypothetical protein [Stenotrophomonas sp. MY18]MRF51219.1 hypothetical protein [Stenotrophomonas sp. MY15]MRG13802.1 hypothetical protein [Stenotrophomonas sp. MY17]
MAALVNTPFRTEPTFAKSKIVSQQPTISLFSDGTQKKPIGALLMASDIIFFRAHLDEMIQGQTHSTDDDMSCAALENKVTPATKAAEAKSQASFRFHALLGACLCGAVVSGLALGTTPYHEVFRIAGAIFAGCAYFLWGKHK